MLASYVFWTITGAFIGFYLAKFNGPKPGY